MIKINDTQTFQLAKLHSLCFVGKEVFLSLARLDWLFMPTKLVWCSEKKGFGKVKIRKRSAFVHEAHKLIPKDKNPWSTEYSLKCSWQEPTAGLLARGSPLQGLQLFFYFGGSWVFPISPPVEIYFKGNFTLSDIVWRRREDRCPSSYMYFFLSSSN